MTGDDKMQVTQLACKNVTFI